MPILAVLLLCQAPAADIDRLVRDLGHEQIEVRERAKREIVTIGTAALLPLRKAAETGNAQMRADAESVIARIDPDIYQLHDLLRKNRPGDPKLDPNGQPWTVATDTAGFRVYGVTREKDTVIRTMAWSYLTRPYFPQEPYGGMRFDVRAEDDSGRPLSIDQCGICSPGIVLVRGHTGPSRIRVTGVQTWFGKLHVDILNPKNGETHEVAGMTLEVSWPRLIVKSKTGWDQRAVQLTLVFDYELKPGAKSLKPPQLNWMRCGGGCDSRPASASWCECEGEPCPGKSNSELPSKKLTYSAEAKNVPIEDVAVIRMKLWKPFEIPFDFTVDVKPHTRK